MRATEEDVKSVVANNSKQRFALSTIDGVVCIRANQGHTLTDVKSEDLLTEIKLRDVSRYPICCHGTYEKCWGSILAGGLNRMARQHIHFSSSAYGDHVISGMRSNVDLVIHVNMEQAIRDGIKFYVSQNKVILCPGIEPTGSLPAKYFSRVDRVSRGRVVEQLTLTPSAQTSAQSTPAPVIAVPEAKCAAPAAATTAAAAVGGDQKKQQRAPQTHTSSSRCQFRYLLVLDFEATCEIDDRLSQQEIIEFPIVVVDTEQGKIVDTFHQYVRPVAHPRLSAFCTELTGITQETVDQGKLFGEVWRDVAAFVAPYTSSAAWVTCGDWDLRTMLPSQLRYSQLSLPAHFQSWINIKQLASDFFTSQLRSSSPHSKNERVQVRGMVDLLQKLRIPLEGRHHSGIDDAKNIAKCMIELIKQGAVVKLTFRPKK